jgi:hypothetical protein
VNQRLIIKVFRPKRNNYLVHKRTEQDNAIITNNIGLRNIEITQDWVYPTENE